MHEGLCLTLGDVIKPAYWALVHSGRLARARPEGLRRNPQTFTKLTFWSASHPATLAQCSGSRLSHDLTA
jgi:hypothetical protein